MKVCLGPVEIGGYYKCLQDGLVSIGIAADFISNSHHPFSYGNSTSETNRVIIFWEMFGRWRSSLSDSMHAQVINRLLGIINCPLTLLVMVITSLKYDVFIFGFGQTFTNTRVELWWLRLLKRKIIFVLHGTDARPTYIDPVYMHLESTVNIDTCYLIAKQQKNRLKKIEQYADAIVSFASLSQLLQSNYINGWLVGLPCVASSNNQQLNYNTSSGIRILHCPSHLQVKGTKSIIDIVNKLKNKGYQIDLVMVHGMPNSKVLEELVICDFVIDQLYSDSPMASFATEAAHFAKPAVVGGYFASHIRDYLSESDIPPSLFVHPDEMEAAIERLIVDQDYRKELGQKAREFVSSRWMPKQVAERFARIISGDIPKHWWSDPNEIFYLHGCGMPEWRAKENVRCMIKRFGKESLQLGDKPDLEQAFVEFAELDPVIT